MINCFKTKIKNRLYQTAIKTFIYDFGIVLDIQQVSKTDFALLAVVSVFDYFCLRIGIIYLFQGFWIQGLL